MHILLSSRESHSERIRTLSGICFKWRPNKSSDPIHYIYSSCGNLNVHPSTHANAVSYIICCKLILMSYCPQDIIQHAKICDESTDKCVVRRSTKISHDSCDGRFNKYRLIHGHFNIGLVIIPRPPHYPETQSRDNMGRGMITRPIWKCPCIKLFITYFRHLEKRHPYWSETKSRPILARANIGLDMEMIL